MGNREIIESAKIIVLSNDCTDYQERIKVCLEDSLYNLSIDKMNTLTYNRTLNKITHLVNTYKHSVIN